MGDTLRWRSQVRHTVDTLRTTTVKDSVDYLIFEIILIIFVRPLFLLA